MSWENFQEDAFNLTKKEVRALTNKVLQNYRNAIKDIDQMLKDVYAKHLTGIDPKDYYNEIIKRDRLKNLLKQVKQEYTKYTRMTFKDTSKLLSLSFSNTYYRKYYAANWLTDKAVFGLLPSRLIELSTLGTNEAWKNITWGIVNKFGDKQLYVPQRGSLANLIRNNATREINRIQSAITQRFINGSSYTQTIKEIRNIIGREFREDKVLKFTGAKSSALRIIRTETNRTMNAASYATSKNLDHNGVDVKRQLAAVFDIKTRRQSARMDGQRVRIDEPFRYPDGSTAIIPGTTGVAKYDINDRESVIDIINDVSPKIRIGRNPKTGKNEVFDYKDFDSWAEEKGLTKNFYGEYIRK